MDFSSDEKCAIESKDRVVKIVKEAGEALSFGDVSKMYFSEVCRQLGCSCCG